MRKGLLLWILFAAVLLALLPSRSPMAAQASPASQQAERASQQAEHASQQAEPVIVTLRMEGALHPVMREHLKRAQGIALREGAELIVLELNTPGGQVELMNQLVEQVRGSDIPVVVYVSPRGAMAASAGTLITLAGHLSAMAPETTIGAASPVGSSGEDIGETMESKVKGVLRATARTLAAHRPPEAIELAEDMIETANAVSVDEALAIGLIDFKATNLNHLLQQLDGATARVSDEERVLRTDGWRVVEVRKTFMEDILTVLANPNIAFLLLAIGVQAVLIEISSPGGWVAGFIGAVCLLLATYGMGLLPVNWFGLLFLVVAFILFILEFQTPTQGGLTVAGVGAFIIGTLVLFNSPNVPAFQRVSVPLVVGTGVAIGLMFFTILGFALRTMRSPVRMGASLVGQMGVVNTPLNPLGTVQIGSELWTAELEEGGPPLAKGERVEITGLENLRVKVRRIAR